MANQMIALQARNPQLPDPARATTQMANMMNMASQQRAAQLQAQRIRQEMDYAAAAEGRAVQTQTSAQKKAELEYVGLVADQFSRDVGKLKEGDIAGAEALRARIVNEIPAWGDYIRPASEWTQDYRVQLMLKGKEIADKTIPDVVASKEYAAAGARDAQGNPIPEGTVIDTRIGGFEGAGGSTPLKERSAATTAPRATPTAPPIAVGEFGEIRVAPDSARPLTPDQQDHIRQMQEDLGMVDTPASFTRGGMAAPTTGPMTPEMAQQIVDAAVKTGMMAQADFDQLMALAPEQNKQPFMDMIKANNITLQPGGMGQQPQFAVNQGQRPQADFAVNRNQPMERTLAQYIPVQRRDPNVSPYPAAAQVPPSVLAAQEAAKTTAQEQAKEAAAAAAAPALAQRERNIAFAKERGISDAKFMESASSVIEAASEGQKILKQMVGDARVNERNQVIVPKGGRSPHAGFESVVGLGVPGLRFVPGTQSADFDAKLKQVLGKAFLKAFDDLRGGGAITEKEGLKATEAVTRLSRFTSEVEFIRAARELEDLLAKGEQKALARKARIEGKPVPRATTPARRTPVRKELVFNPATGDFD